MVFSAGVVAALAQLCAGSWAPAFSTFVQKHGRSYGAAEFAARKQLYQQRLAEATEWNSQPDRLWTAGINHLSDWTEEELRSIRGWRGHGVEEGHAPRSSSFLLQKQSIDLTVENHIWNSSTVGEAADQGSCGSCWAVATAKMSETNHYIHTGQHRSFSAQDLVNCVPNPESCGGSGGCQGATVELAMALMMERGLSTDDGSPYHGTDAHCSLPPSSLLEEGAVRDAGGHFRYAGMSLAKLVKPDDVKLCEGDAARSIGLHSWLRLPLNKEAPLQEYLMQGTVAVSVQGAGWSGYSSGIFDSCSRDAIIDHAVTAIGFGKDENSGHKYWTILNSWGPEWGESGKIRLLRTSDQHCGTDSMPKVGTGCDNGPSSVTVCGMCGIYYDNVFAKFKSQQI